MTGLGLKLFRVVFNLSQKEAAEEIGGVSQRSWAYWENGERPIPQDVLLKINFLFNRRRQVLEEVEKMIKNKKHVAVVFYERHEECGMSLMDLKFNNSVVATLFFKFDIKAVKFDLENYQSWLKNNNFSDSTQKRSEWAVYQSSKEAISDMSGA